MKNFRGMNQQATAKERPRGAAQRQLQTARCGDGAPRSTTTGVVADIWRRSAGSKRQSATPGHISKACKTTQWKREQGRKGHSSQPGVDSAANTNSVNEEAGEDAYTVCSS